MDDVQGESSSEIEDDILESVAQGVSGSVTTSSSQSFIKKLSESSLCLSFFYFVMFYVSLAIFCQKGGELLFF